MADKDFNLDEVKMEEISARICDLAGNMAKSNLRQLVHDLGKQILDGGEREIVMEQKITLAAKFAGGFSLDCETGWKRQVKVKDTSATVDIDFEQPDLPGVADDGKTIEMPKQLVAGMKVVTPCLCGHFAMSHDDGKGACDECPCEMFEVEKPEVPDTPESEQESEPGETVNPPSDVSERPLCTCGHSDTSHDDLGCCFCTCKSLELVKPEVPVDNSNNTETELVTAYRDDRNAQRDRNIVKLLKLGIVAVTMADGDKRLCFWEPKGEGFDRMDEDFVTKAACKRAYNQALDSGAVNPESPVRVPDKITALVRWYKGGPVRISDGVTSWGLTPIQDINHYRQLPNVLEG